MKKISEYIEKYMIFIVVITTLLSLFFPKLFLFLKNNYINYLLMLIMFGMGINVRFSDFYLIFKSPFKIFIGTLSQFIIMPLIAFLLCKLFKANNEITVGVILVGSCPGGTASNVITYLSDGDVPLSITMTTINTLLSPIITPLLVYLFLRTKVYVDIINLSFSIITIVIFPIIVGFILNKYLNKFVNVIRSFMPSVSIISICLIISIIVSNNSYNILHTGKIIFIIVILHNILGFIIGYYIGYIFRFSKKQQIALSIEVGMQNSGLATSLAHTSFSNLSMATVPGALFSVWHNISGAIISHFFKNC